VRLAEDRGIWTAARTRCATYWFYTGDYGVRAPGNSGGVGARGAAERNTVRARRLSARLSQPKRGSVREANSHLVEALSIARKLATTSLPLRRS